MPKDTIPAEYKNCEWYIYNANYTNLVIVLVQEQNIVGIYADGTDFSYKDITTATTATSLTEQGYRNNDNVCSKTDGTIRQFVFIDALGDNTAEGIFIVDRTVYNRLSITDRESTLERISFEVTNSFRVKNGLNELEWCDEVAVVARAHSEDMKNNDFFAHESYDGTEFSTRITNAGIDWRGCAENIAAGYTDSFYATYGWINSSGHRNNILTDHLSHLGVGVVLGGSYRVYYTQDFYTPW